ncbi:hypothetical protein [Sphingopyxis terrae]|nr:hypothetical protein [Sphingopyxis terrae]
MAHLLIPLTSPSGAPLSGVVLSGRSIMRAGRRLGKSRYGVRRIISG